MTNKTYYIGIGLCIIVIYFLSAIVKKLYPETILLINNIVDFIWFVYILWILRFVQLNYFKLKEENKIKIISKNN